MENILISKHLLFFTIGFTTVLFSSCDVQKLLNKVDIASPLGKAKPQVDSLARVAGRGLVTGIGERSKEAIDSMINGLKGSVDTLDPEIKKLIEAIRTIGDTTSLQISKVGNNIHWQIGRLKGDVRLVIGTVTRLTDKLTARLNDQTKNLLNNMIQAALDSLQTPRSRSKIDSILSGILSESTTINTQKLVNGALQPTIDTLSNRIDRIVHKDIPFLQRRAGMLLTSLAVIAIGIISFVWYQRRKYLRLLKILTYQIDKIPNTEIYDEITRNISSETKREDLEPLLRKTLAEQGIN